jgi:hypothetical protein
MNFRDAYEFDPETYQGGGLPGRLLAMMRSGQFGPAPDTNATASPEYNADTYSGEAGLLGRLRALVHEQAVYQPAPANGGPPPSAPPDPNFRQLVRVSPGPLSPMSNASSPHADSSPPTAEAIQPNEMELAQQARDAAAARLARGASGNSRAQIPAPDAADIAASAGIGVINGAINTAGLPAEILSGFGHLPKNLVPNLFRLMDGRPQLPADEPDHLSSWKAEALRRWLEERIGTELYQPRTTSGRYAEKIGEFAPMPLWGWLRGSAAATSEGMRALGHNLLTDAAIPGTVVQGLEDAFPDSKVGPMVQKGWPWIRYLSR